MFVLLVLVLLSLLIVTINAAYPSTSLQCYSFLTQPDEELICPEARDEYCVKETSTLTQDICGATQYFGDQYRGGICQFKKCSEECVAGTYTFQFEGNTYSRTRYCCKTSYCNTSSSSGLSSYLFGIIITVISIYLYFQ